MPLSESGLEGCWWAYRHKQRSQPSWYTHTQDNQIKRSNIRRKTRNHIPSIRPTLIWRSPEVGKQFFLCIKNFRAISGTIPTPMTISESIPWVCVKHSHFFLLVTFLEKNQKMLYISTCMTLFSKTSIQTKLFFRGASHMNCPFRKLVIP